MVSKPKRYKVLLTQGAEQDLESIHDYMTEFDCVANANSVLDQLMEVVEGLAQFPERGSYPKELVALGIKEYRQTAFNLSARGPPAPPATSRTCSTAMRWPIRTPA